MWKKTITGVIKKWFSSRPRRIATIFLILCLIIQVFGEIYRDDINIMIYLSFLFFVTGVPFVGILIIETFRRQIIKWLKKQKNTPKIFEFLFFLFLFLATLFATFMAMYGGSVSTHENVIAFLQYNWLWMSSYGLAIVFGIYHYIERLDVVNSYDEFGVKKMSEKEVKINLDTGKKIKNENIRTLLYKLFSTKEREKIDEIYKKACSEEDFEEWRYLVDTFDDKIGGIGSKRLMIKKERGYTGNYPSDSIPYRSLQYVLAYFFVARNEGTRLGILYCCMHIEGIMKVKFTHPHLPLGAIVDRIKKGNMLDTKMIELLDNVVPIWNEVKHELDDEPLTFQIKDKKVIRSSDHKFSMYEVVIMYFISRKIGVMLT